MNLSVHHISTSFIPLQDVSFQALCLSRCLVPLAGVLGTQSFLPTLESDMSISLVTMSHQFIFMSC